MQQSLEGKAERVTFFRGKEGILEQDPRPPTTRYIAHLQIEKRLE